MADDQVLRNSAPVRRPPLRAQLWARDYNEIKALGGKSNSRRTAEQTQIASFWEATLPPIYNGIVLSVADVPGREVTQNARLFAAVAQAADDALLAVFDAKYHYNFWRPVTAIRNGDLDGNDATERDASWTPFIETPMHPEYPCAHCIVAGAVGTVLQAEIGTGAMPTLTTTSYLVKGPARTWTKIDDFMQEVGNARVYDGVHFRNSTEVGTAMGKQIGALAVAKFLRRLTNEYGQISVALYQNRAPGKLSSGACPILVGSSYLSTDRTGSFAQPKSAGWALEDAVDVRWNAAPSSTKLPNKTKTRPRSPSRMG